MCDERLSRRAALARMSSGFGLAAFAALNAGAQEGRRAHPARAKSVIFAYLSGGMSHVDSFDPKPELLKRAGKPMPVPVLRTQFNQNGTIQPSHWAYRPRGKSGLEISELFPRLGELADRLAVLRSMTTKFSEHAQGNLYMHTGFPFVGYPSAGAWTSYGLGSEAANLPGFVVLRSGDAVAPHGGVGVYGSGFLPAKHEASILGVDRPEPLANLKPREEVDRQRRALDFTASLDRRFSEDPAVESAIRNAELAWKMQASVPELCGLDGESEATKKMYGMDDPDPKTAAYARQCLVARRLVERGVRFVELSCLTYNIGAGNGPNPWDQHSDIKKGHGAQAHQIDRPLAALLLDLERRGLLESTLVVSTGEFGRTPFSQGSNGRDHNPYGFSAWMAGGGVKGGQAYGATDELGYHAVEKPCTVYDLWATVLHQLGVDHEALTFRFGGRDLRLTDVHGHVLEEILA